jgi:hypothetical protein
MIKSIGRNDGIRIDETFAEIYRENEETAASDYAAYKNVPFYKYDVRDMNKVVKKIIKIVADNS